MASPAKNPFLRRIFFVSVIIIIFFGSGYLISQGVRYQVNLPLTRADGHGYRFSSLDQQENSNSLFIIVTFSGGGTRAAALSYGVLEHLENTTIYLNGKRRKLIDEIDVISSVSGGSFTAAYYGLFREKLFETFPETFLYRNIEKELKLKLLMPMNWFRLASRTFGRIDLASEFYDQEIFKSATFSQLIERGRPLILINATDMSVGSRFTFTQNQFDLICSDLSKFPIARAVAASSNFPIAFTPLVLNNYAGNCGFQVPDWINNGLMDLGINWPRFQRAKVAKSYLDSTVRRHIHLLDGGISDNIGLLAPLVALSSNDSDFSVLSEINRGVVKDVVVIVVDAKTSASIRFDDSPISPNIVEIVETISTVPMQNYSAATVQELFQLINKLSTGLKSYDDCNKLLDELCPSGSKLLPPRRFSVHGVHVSFDFVKDAQKKAYLNKIPTSFILSREEIDTLRKVGGDLLNESQEFQEFLSKYNESR